MNKFFQKMQHRLLLLLILSTLIPVSIVGWYGISSSTEALQKLALITLSDSVNSTANQMINKFENLRADILFLPKTPPVQGMIRAKEGNGVDKKTNSTYKDWVYRMQLTFLAMMEAKPYYMQLRYIDNSGKEIVRVDSDGKNIQVIPDSQLQNKADRDYCRATMKLKSGEVYVSSLELNQERGKIEIPYKPTIRYATPIFNPKGERQGILISNALGSTLIDIVKNFNHELSDQSFILNQDGYYLGHPNPKKAWGFELKTKENVKNDYSGDIVAKILSGGKGNIDNRDLVISYNTVFTSKENTNKFLVIVEASPKKLLFYSIDYLQKIAALIAIVSLAVVLGFGLFLLQKIVALIRGMIYQVSSFSLQIESNMNRQEQIANRQFLSVNQTTITLENLGRSSQQTAEQAESVAVAARQALNLAEEGTKKVDQTLNQMLNLREAAVVASEIRKLADESQQAAQKINGIIPEIKGAIDSTLKATEDSRKTVAEGVKTAQDTAEAFTGVREACNLVFASNQQISFNVKHQAIAIQQVGDAMISMKESASQTVSGIDQVKIGTQKLTEAAFNLKEVV